MVNVFSSQGYHAQQIGNKDQMMLQLKKGGDFEAIIGMQAAVSLTLQRTAGGVLAMIGQQKWIDKAAVGAVGIVAFPVLWPLALTAGVGTLRQASLGNQVLNMVDGLVRQQRPGIMAGPVPLQLLPQAQQQWGAPPVQTPMYSPPPQNQGYLAPPQTPAYNPPQQVVVSQVSTPPQQGLRCPNCNTPHEPGDTFCSGCGRSLTPAKEFCPNCNAELKTGTAFCPRCGASTFRANKNVGQTPVQAPPAYTPPSVPPVRPATPVYTPPVPPSRPATPMYVPSSATPAYTPPAQPNVEPYAAPTFAAPPTPAKPVEPLYVPPTTQDPPVAPPTTISYIQSTVQKPDAPPASAKPKPEKQYYIPSEQTQQAASQPTLADQVASKPVQPAPAKPKPEKQYYIPSEQAQQAASQPTLANQPVEVKAASQPAIDVNTVWGTVTFADSSQVELKGERAIVGRADHDLEGEPPEIDLSHKQGADTVSRVHAVIEHSGSGYTLTDLNSTNATRLNGKRLDPDKEIALNDGDALQFGKVTATFKKV